MNIPKKLNSALKVGLLSKSAIIGAAFTLPLAVLQAADRTWQLTSGEGNFVDAVNWSDGTVPAGSDQAIISQAGSTVLVNSGDTLSFGRLQFAAGILRVDGATISNTVTGNSGWVNIYSNSSGTGEYELEVSGGTAWHTVSQFRLGGLSGTVTDVLVTGSGTVLSSDDYFYIGINDGGTANVTLDNGAKISKKGATDSTRMVFGEGNGTTANLTVNNGSRVESESSIVIAQDATTATVVLNDDSSMALTTTSGDVSVGRGSGANGTLIFNDDSAGTFTGWFNVGRSGGNGTVEIHDTASLSTVGAGTGRHFVIGISSGTGTVVMDGTGSELIVENDLQLGLEGGSGHLTMSDNSSATVGGVVAVGLSASGSGTITMSGNSRISAEQIVKGAGSGTVTFGGGTVAATTDIEDYFPGFDNEDINIQAGGLSFDTGIYSVTVSQSLGNGGEGGLTKLGAGVLTIESVSYTGDTMVEEGTLQLNAASLADGADVYLAAGTVLDLNFSGEDTIRYLYIDGVLQAAGEYSSTNLGEYISGEGSLFVAVPEPSTMALVVGGALGVLAMIKSRRKV